MFVPSCISITTKTMMPSKAKNVSCWKMLYMLTCPPARPLARPPPPPRLAVIRRSHFHVFPPPAVCSSSSFPSFSFTYHAVMPVRLHRHAIITPGGLHVIHRRCHCPPCCTAVTPSSVVVCRRSCCCCRRPPSCIVAAVQLLYI